MKVYKLLLLFIVASTLQACASGPGKPGEAPLTQPPVQPNTDYIYRSPPPDVARALI